MPGDNALRRDGDRELLDLVRAGDPDAYGLLYTRHAGAAHRFARSLVSNRTDADDAVAEVFASLLATLRRGRGPTDLFLPYLLTSIRNECQRVNRRGSRESVAGYDRLGSDLDARRHQDDPVSQLAEAEVITTALTTLPDNLREILWRTEVRDEPAREIAAQRGATPHAVAETALRARRALGNAYLQLHAAGGARVDDLEAACRDARPYLAAYVRRSVGTRRRRHIERHLLTCQGCADAHEELGRVNRRLRLVPALPIDVGAAGTASLGVKAQLTAWLSASATPIAASGMVVATVLGPVMHVPAAAQRERPVVVVDDPVTVPLVAPPTATTIVVDTAGPIVRPPQPAETADAAGVAAAVGAAPATAPPATLAPVPVEPVAAVEPVTPVDSVTPVEPVAPEPASTSDAGPSPTAAPTATPAEAPPPAAVAPAPADAAQPTVTSASPAAPTPGGPAGANGNGNGMGAGPGNGNGLGQPMLGNGNAAPPAVGVTAVAPTPPAATPSPGPPEHAAVGGAGHEAPRRAVAATAPAEPGNPIAAERAGAARGNGGGRAVDLGDDAPAG